MEKRAWIIIGLLLILAWPALANENHDDDGRNFYWVCTPSGTDLVKGKGRYKQGLKRGWWVSGKCDELPDPEPEPEPDPEPPPVVVPPEPGPQPPYQPSPPPVFLPAGTVEDGPAVCKALPDVRAAGEVVVTNVTDQPMSCNVWQFHDNGTSYQNGVITFSPRQKQRIRVDLGYFGWWRIKCSQTFRAASIIPNLDLAGTAGAYAREAERCLE